MRYRPASLLIPCEIICPASSRNVCGDTWESVRDCKRSDACVDISISLFWSSSPTAKPGNRGFPEAVPC